jgi:ribosomal protein L11
MAKEVQKVLKLQIRGGAANPSPPVGQFKKVRKLDQELG